MPLPALSAALVLWLQVPVAEPLRSGREVYAAACITCHGPDGTGSPRSTVGFDTPLPDFTDCAFATAEPDPDWFAVVHEGGTIRGLDHHMPAFGSALSAEEIQLAVSHLRTFCREPGWPRGDLNFPRAFFTEKAFPENEAVWVTSFSSHEGRSIGNDLIYERRLGARSQIEISAPLNFQQSSQAFGSEWTAGVGDLALALKRVLHARAGSNHIASAGLEVILPTGDRAQGLGNGVTVFEPFAMWDAALPRNAFVQFHGGAEFPTDSSRGTREIYLRSAIGTTLAVDRGFGRAWSPQVEVLWAKPVTADPDSETGDSEWDLVPQLQVTLSKLQHVMIAGGVRIPITERDRGSQGLVYLVWDWFDGGFLEFWK